MPVLVVSSETEKSLLKVYLVPVTVRVVVVGTTGVKIRMSVSSEVCRILLC